VAGSNRFFWLPLTAHQTFRPAPFPAPLTCSAPENVAFEVPNITKPVDYAVCGALQQNGVYRRRRLPSVEQLQLVSITECGKLSQPFIDLAINHEWRRRLECVVQRQARHTDHLLWIAVQWQHSVKLSSITLYLKCGIIHVCARLRMNKINVSKVWLKPHICMLTFWLSN